MSIDRKQCFDHELVVTEAQWRAQGYRLVQKFNEKDLLPFEYFKTSHRGSEASIEGAVKWELCRRKK